jgi:hypothetical protein
MSAKDGIRPDSPLKEVIKNQKAKSVLKRYGFACFDCGGLGTEKLRHAARCHGFDVKNLIQEILKATSHGR